MVIITSKCLLATLIIIKLGFELNCNAQISIVPSDASVFTADSLVKQMVGTGVLVSNVSYNLGTHSSGLGYYQDPNSILGINRGLIMSTGPVLSTPGPNSNFFLSGFVSGTSSDSLLSGLINNQSLEDLSTLSFDFIPLSDTLKFNFVFGSEEYSFYSCPGMLFNYNDVFGFFVNGPNPAGGQYNNFNIARLPTTTTNTDVVSILNVTSGGCAQSCSANPSFFIPNYSNCPQNPGSFNIAYDGFTVKITATIAVIPCQTYSLKMAIADVRDQLFDSFVVIEEGFITTPSKLTVGYWPTFSQFEDAIEGCHPVDVVFKKTSPDPLDETVFYELTGLAQNGIDYGDILGNALPGVFVFPAFSDSVVLRIFPLVDSIAEPVEDIVIKLFLPCQNSSTDSALGDNVTLLIKENFDYDLGPDQWICNGDSAKINSSPVVSTDSIFWSPSIGLSCINCLSPNALPVSNTQYVATITDAASGCKAIDSVGIFKGNTADLAINDTLVCFGTTVTLFVDTAVLSAFGNVGIAWQSSPGITSFDLTSPTINIFVQNSESVYFVYFTFPGGCVVYDSIIVSSSPIFPDLIKDLILCISEPTKFVWNPGTFDSIQWRNIPPGTISSDSSLIVSLAEVGVIQASGNFFLNGCFYSGFLDLRVRNPIKTEIEAGYELKQKLIPLVDNDVIDAFPPIPLSFSTSISTSGTKSFWYLSFDSGPFDFVTSELSWFKTGKANGIYALRLIQTLEDSSLIQCWGYDSLHFRIRGPVIPNMISPNGDGLNDIFVIRPFFQSNVLGLKILNRWGRVVFESTNYQDNWGADGLEGGVYFYTINHPTEKESYQGWIQVIK